MSQQSVQFREGYSIDDLAREYGSEQQCEEALFSWRWPNGFVCSECGSHSYSKLGTHRLYQCSYCHHETALTSGTIFKKTKLHLTTWFLAIHLLTQSEADLSALELKKKLGVSYRTAWLMKHKIMQIIRERDDLTALKEFTWVNTYDWQYKRCHDSYLAFDFSKLYVPGARVSRRASGSS